MKKNCDNCGGQIPEDKRSDTRFCSNTCKAEYWAKQKELKKNGNGFSGIGLKMAPKKEPDLNDIPKNEKETEELIFHNTIDENEENNEPEIKTLSGFSDDQNKNLPIKWIMSPVNVINPIYQDYTNKLNFCQKEIIRGRDEIDRLKILIQNEKTNEGNGIVLLGTVGGGIIGASLTDNNEKPILSAYTSKFSKKSKPQMEIPKPAFSFLKILGGAVAGAITGNIIKGLTKDFREGQKKVNIKKYEDQIAGITIMVSRYTQAEKELKRLISITPKETQNIAPAVNPEYTKALADNIQAVEKPLQNNLKTVLQKDLSGADPSLETDKILSAKNMANKHIPVLNFKGAWLNFFGLPQTNFFTVIHGMSGEGKTNFTIQFAKYLAENFGTVLYVSGEEGFAPTMQKKIQALGAMVTNLYIGDLKTGDEILEEVPNKYHFIIIDSINNMNITPELMKTIRQKFKQSGVIAIAQSTKDDKIRGSYQIVHDSDITIKVKNGIAVTTKNRFKEKGMEFDIFAIYRKGKQKGDGGSPNEGLDKDFKNTV